MGATPGQASMGATGICRKNSTSIDPKQLQNDSFGPILAKSDFLVRPTFPPRANCFISYFCRHANCSAAGQEKTRGQDPVTEPGHRVKGRGQSVGPALVSTARGQEKDKRSGHRAWPQSSGARPRQGQEEDKRRTKPGHRAQPQSSGGRPASVASSFF